MINQALIVAKKKIGQERGNTKTNRLNKLDGHLGSIREGKPTTRIILVNIMSISTLVIDQMMTNAMNI